MLRPLPVERPEELISLAAVYPDGVEPVFSYAAYRQIRGGRGALVDAIAASTVRRDAVTLDGLPEPVDLKWVSGNYFTTLGVACGARDGRCCASDDRQPPGEAGRRAQRRATGHGGSAATRRSSAAASAEGARHSPSSASRRAGSPARQRGRGAGRLDAAVGAARRAVRGCGAGTAPPGCGSWRGAARSHPRAGARAASSPCTAASGTRSRPARTARSSGRACSRAGWPSRRRAAGPRRLRDNLSAPLLILMGDRRPRARSSRARTSRT